MQSISGMHSSCIWGNLFSFISCILLIWCNKWNVRRWFLVLLIISGMYYLVKILIALSRFLSSLLDANIRVLLCEPEYYLREHSHILDGFGVFFTYITTIIRYFTTYICLFNKIRCSLTYLPTKKSDSINDETFL